MYQIYASKLNENRTKFSLVLTVKLFVFVASFGLNHTFLVTNCHLTHLAPIDNRVLFNGVLHMCPYRIIQSDLKLGQPGASLAFCKVVADKKENADEK